jgi:branched-chain amino acid transport system substrate-binding protein
MTEIFFAEMAAFLSNGHLQQKGYDSLMLDMADMKSSLKTAGFCILCLIVCPAASEDHTKNDAAKDEISIGCLLPLTGDMGDKGMLWRQSLEIAALQMNDFFSSVGSKKRVRLSIKDTQTDPQTALVRTQELKGEGIRIIVGPGTSEETLAILDYCDMEGMLIIGFCSAAQSLSIPMDNLIRLVPNDSNQGRAAAALMKHDGIKTMIPLMRSDVWASDLFSATKESFTSSGGRCLDPITYPAGCANFSLAASRLNETLFLELKNSSARDIAVYYLGFQEAVPLFNEASKHHTLRLVRWFGSDGTGMMDCLRNDSASAAFAIATGFINPVYQPILSPHAEEVRSMMLETTGREADAYSLVAHDAIEIASIASALVGGDDPKQLKIAVTNTANSYFGTTGWTGLDNAGDRRIANYEFWEIKCVNGSNRWQQRDLKFKVYMQNLY